MKKMNFYYYFDFSFCNFNSSWMLLQEYNLYVHINAYICYKLCDAFNFNFDLYFQPSYTHCYCTSAKKKKCHKLNYCFCTPCFKGIQFNGMQTFFFYSVWNLMQMQEEEKKWTVFGCLVWKWKWAQFSGADLIPHTACMLCKMYHYRERAPLRKHQNVEPLFQ